MQKSTEFAIYLPNNTIIYIFFQYFQEIFKNFFQICFCNIRKKRQKPPNFHMDLPKQAEALFRSEMIDTVWQIQGTVSYIRMRQPPRLTGVEPRRAETGKISARLCFVTPNTPVYLRSSATTEQKFCPVSVPRKFVPPPFFGRRSAISQIGCRLSKNGARQTGKGGVPNRDEFDSRQLKPWRRIRTRFWMEYFPNLFAEKPYHTSV